MRQQRTAIMHVSYNLLRSKLPESPRTSLGLSHERIWTYQWSCGCIAEGEDERALTVAPCLLHYSLFNGRLGQ
jgi:hypothetical protein